MNNNNEKKPKIYISNEGLCGRSIPISRDEFNKIRNYHINTSNNQPNQSNTNDKPKIPPTQPQKDK